MSRDLIPSPAFDSRIPDLVLKAAHHSPIILSLLNCPAGGFLFVDEIDTGLHYSVQKKLWEMIFSLVKDLEIQVFAATHSMDCLRSFAAVNNSEKGLLVRLDTRSDGDIVPQYYSDPEYIRFAIEKQIDLR